MEQTVDEDNLDGPAQRAAYRLEMDEEDGCVWAHSLPGDPAPWGVNLGPRKSAMAVMADFLAENDFEE